MWARLAPHILLRQRFVRYELREEVSAWIRFEILRILIFHYIYIHFSVYFCKCTQSNLTGSPSLFSHAPQRTPSPRRGFFTRSQGSVGFPGDLMPSFRYSPRVEVCTWHRSSPRRRTTLQSSVGHLSDTVVKPAMGRLTAARRTTRRCFPTRSRQRRSVRSSRRPRGRRRSAARRRSSSCSR